jgi:hypothetical protein
MKRFRNAFVLFSMTLIAAGTQMGGCGDSDSDSDGGGESSGLALFAGSLGGSGNIDGIGTAARFESWGGMTSDGTYFYIADSGNHTIRKMVIATGEVTTIAGKAGVQGTTDDTGTAARFYKPSGIVIVGDYLYVTEWGNNTIRRIDISSLWVTTFAGTAGISGSTDDIGIAAQFWNPSGITTDGTSLYISDNINSTIRQIVISTKVVTTLAGTALSNGSTNGTGAAARFKWPEGIVFHGGYLYVADQGNHTIRKIDIGSKYVDTIGGYPGTQGSADGPYSGSLFATPSGITTDGTYLYVSDSWNAAIRKIDMTFPHITTTLAGEQGYSGPYPDYERNALDGTGTDARFTNSLGYISIDGGNLYVSDENSFRKVVIATKEVTTVAGSLDNDGSTDGIGTAARFKWPTRIASDGTNLYIADSGNHTIRKIVISTGVVTTLAGTAGVYGTTDDTGTAAQFNFPNGMATDGTHLYVVDSSNYTIRKIVISTGEVTTLAGSAGLDGYTDGTGSDARFTTIAGIAIDGTNLYVTDGCSIRKISTLSRLVTTIAGKGDTWGSVDDIGTSARFYYPFGIATDGANLYISDSLNHTIRKVVLATLEVTTIAGTAQSIGSEDLWCCERFNWPEEIEVVGTNLYIVDKDNHTIRKIDLTTGVVTTPIGSAGLAGGLLGPLPSVLNEPSGIEIVDGKIYISNNEDHSILVAPLP